NRKSKYYITGTFMCLISIVQLGDPLVVLTFGGVKTIEDYLPLTERGDRFTYPKENDLALAFCSTLASSIYGLCTGFMLLIFARFHIKAAATAAVIV
ncbi:hypothetical protein IWQ56_001865, partial [Coemansia nantahalensis]